MEPKVTNYHFLFFWFFLIFFFCLTIFICIDYGIRSLSPLYLHGAFTHIVSSYTVYIYI